MDVRHVITTSSWLASGILAGFWYQHGRALLLGHRDSKPANCKRMNGVANQLAARLTQ